MWEFARAGERVAPRGDRRLPGRTYRCNSLLDHSLFERRDRAARGFDLLKQRPGGAAELTGQVAYGAGARGWIGNLREVRFFEQDELGVAREPAREAVGKPERG